jgi:ankyrin repeat protein
MIGAFDRGNPRALQFLFVGGKYGTALHSATYHKNGEIVALLLDRNADPNALGEL